MTDSVLDALARSPAAATLTALRVNPVGSPAAVELLSDGKAFPKLVDLMLGTTRVGQPDRQQVARLLGVHLPASG